MHSVGGLQGQSTEDYPRRERWQTNGNRHHTSLPIFVDKIAQDKVDVNVMVPAGGNPRLTNPLPSRWWNSLRVPSISR